MATKEENLPIQPLLREPRWTSLVATLDAAAREGKIGVEAHDAILEPARLLNDIGHVAPNALGWGHEPATELDTLLFDAAAHTRPLPRSTIDAAHGNESGLVDFVVLVVAGLATIRTHSRDSEQSARDGLSTLYGLTLAAAPAAFLAQSLPETATTADVAAAIDAMSHRDGSWRSHPTMISMRACVDRLFVRLAGLVPERASFSCDALGTIHSLSAPDAAPGQELDLVGHFPDLDPMGEWPSNLQVYFASRSGGRVKASAKKWGKKKIKVVVPPGARPGWIGLIDKDAEKKCKSFRDQLVKELFATSDPCLPATIDASVPQAIRGRSSRYLPERTSTNAYVGSVPKLQSVIVTPEYVRPNDDVVVRWTTLDATGVIVDPGVDVQPHATGEAKVHVDANAHDADGTVTVTPYRGEMGIELRGDAQELTYRVREPASIVAVKVTQGQRTEPPFVRDLPLDVMVSLSPLTSLASVVMTLDGHSTRHEARAKSDPGWTKNDVVFSIDPLLLHDRLSFKLAAQSIPEVDDGDPVDVGPLAFEASRQRVLVVVRPKVLVRVEDRVELSEATPQDVADLKKSLEHDLGLAIDVAEPPWIDDALAVLTSYVDDADDSRVPTMMDELAMASLRTPGFEDAIWLALLPTDPSANAGFSASSYSVAARALVVSDVVGAFEKIRSIHHDNATSTDPAAMRLRLSAHVAVDGSVALDPSRRESRAASTGHAADAGVDAYTLDRWGRTLASVPFECVKTTPPRSIVALVPVDDDVASIEIRKVRKQESLEKRKDRNLPEDVLFLQALMEEDELAPRGRRGDLVATITRFNQGPSLSGVSLKGSTLRWRYAHPLGARGELFVELAAKHKKSSRDIVTAVLRLDPDESSAELPLARFAGGGTLRLVATDGWNFVASDAIKTSHGSHGVVVRKLETGEFWADSDRSAEVTWSLGALTLETQPVDATLRLSAFLRGTLKLAMGGAVIDWRPVGGGPDAYDRP
jgi:hypothetical protein